MATVYQSFITYLLLREQLYKCQKAIKGLSIFRKDFKKYFIYINF